MSAAKNQFFVETYREQLKELGNRIKMARQARGMTQGEVADQIGVSAKTVSALEVARVEPSISQMQALASVLREPIGYFTGEPASTVQSKMNRVADELKQVEKLLEAMRSHGK